jgi:dienelactone hydrolase
MAWAKLYRRPETRRTPRGWLGGVTGRPNTPPEVVATLADAYGALEFLSNLPNVDPDRIAIMGFSFGGVLSMLSATTPYTNRMTGGQMKFAAHIAHYPICWIYNVIPGAEFMNLTGSPVLIQVGELDDYHAPDTCPNLVESLPDETHKLVSLNVYHGATHAWDRLQPPITVFDPFACFGQGCEVDIVPSVGTAFESRARAVKFLKAAFGHN